MVAEFRLEKPNMSYVNVNAGSNGCSSNGERLTVRKGNIVRGGDSTLFSGLLHADPQTRSIFMGGPGIGNEELGHLHQQQHLYQGQGQNFNEPNSSYDSLPSASSSSDLPRLRVANLPRNDTAFSSSISGESYPRNDQYGHHNMQSSLAADGSMPYVPSVTTVIRTTSLEYSVNPAFNFQAQESGVESSRNVQNRRMQRPHRQKLASDGGFSRVTHQQMSRTFSTPAMTETMPQGSVMQDNESLLRENEDLKKKLKLLVNTINDEEKLAKVLKCLEERRKAKVGVS